MATPVGMTTATLSVGPVESLTGEIATLKVEATMVFGKTTRLINTLSGRVLTSKLPVKAASGLDGIATLELPHVDQNGWQDPTGKSASMWKYDVEVSATFDDGGFESWKQTVQPVTTQTGTIDIDLLPNEPAADAQVSIIPAVTDIVGLTGSISKAELEAAGIGGGGAALPAGGTVGQVLAKLSATDQDVGWQNPGQPAAHTHTISEVGGLADALAGKSNTGHSHEIANINNLQATLDGKAAATHAHAIADITSLQLTLDGKASTTQAVPIGGTTGQILAKNSATNNDVVWINPPSGGTGGTSDHGGLTGLLDDDHTQYALADGTRGSFAAATHGHTISEITDLSNQLAGKAAATHAHSASEITSGTLDPNRLPVVTTTVQGAMSASDKVKLNNATATATASRIVERDLNGRAQFADPAADADVATRGWTNTGLAGKAASTHSHVIADTTGLQTALDNKVDDSEFWYGTRANYDLIPTKSGSTNYFIIG